MTLQKTIGQIIYAKRIALGISQMKLAELSGLHLNSINKIEAGLTKLHVETLFKIARGLNCSAWELIAAVEGKPFKMESEGG